MYKMPLLQRKSVLHKRKMHSILYLRFTIFVVFRARNYYTLLSFSYQRCFIDGSEPVWRTERAASCPSPSRFEKSLSGSRSGYQWLKRGQAMYLYFLMERWRGETRVMSKLVMIADDSPTIRKIVEVVLAREGYEVVAVPDGVEALRYLLTSDMPPPDLILLDLVMPRLDGLQVARKIKEHPQLKPIPLVILSRRTGIVDRLFARLAGARGYLTKPFTEQQLRHVVGSLIGPAHPGPAVPRQPGPVRLVHAG